MHVSACRCKALLASDKVLKYNMKILLITFLTDVKIDTKRIPHDFNLCHFELLDLLALY